MDTHSSQVKVFYFNDKDHFNYSYWFHLEDSMEIAPFQSKYMSQNLHISKEELLSVSDISEMDDDESDHNDNISEAQSPDYSALSSPKHSYCSIQSSESECKQKESMLHQLANFGYNEDEIRFAMAHVSNPNDINQIVEYMTAKDMKQLIEEEKPKRHPVRHNFTNSNDSLQSFNDALFDEKEAYDSDSNSDEIYEQCKDPKVSVTPKVLSRHASVSVFGADSILMKSTFVLDKDYGVPIPNILIKLKKALFVNRGHLEKFVFDASSDDTKCKQMRDHLNEGNMQIVDFNKMDVVVIANLIKLWFQSLPKRILHDVDVKKLGNCENIHDAADIIKNDIGEPNESLFKWLLDFCVDVVQFDEMNKMSVKYMAKVFGPTLLDEDDHAFVEKFVQLSILYRHFEKQK